MDYRYVFVLLALAALDFPIVLNQGKIKRKIINCGNFYKKYIFLHDFHFRIVKNVEIYIKFFVVVC